MNLDRIIIGLTIFLMAINAIVIYELPPDINVLQTRTIIGTVFIVLFASMNILYGIYFKMKYVFVLALTAAFFALYNLMRILTITPDFTYHLGLASWKMSRVFDIEAPFILVQIFFAILISLSLILLFILLKVYFTKKRISKKGAIKVEYTKSGVKLS